MEKVIMRFMGCKVILESDFEDKTYQKQHIERAEKRILKVFEKEYRQPSDKELKEIVERDLGITINKNIMENKLWKMAWIFLWIAVAYFTIHIIIGIIR